MLSRLCLSVSLSVSVQTTAYGCLTVFFRRVLLRGVFFICSAVFLFLRIHFRNEQSRNHQCSANIGFDGQNLSGKNKRYNPGKHRFQRENDANVSRRGILLRYRLDDKSHAGAEYGQEYRMIRKKGNCVLKCEDGDLVMPSFVLEFKEV